MSEPFTVLIMAAGQGTRMRSELPKVLHQICGKPMVEWVIDAAKQAGASRVVAVFHCQVSWAHAGIQPMARRSTRISRSVRASRASATSS